MSDDLIKRADVYKAVDDWLAGRVPNLNIKAVPSADRPQGEWISKGKKIYRCSNCGNYLDFDGVNASRGDANFCPNCGADMREREGE